jgi:cobalt/nickel transport protein
MGSENEKSKTEKIAVKNIILFLLVIVLAVIPFWLQKGAKFGGSDDKATGVITQIKPDYKPWFKSIWKPPSTEVESLLFALQASIGSLIIGYYFGYVRGRKKREDVNKK